jgi:ABC-type Mn2+/Zn2+ transport system permease subunit
MDTTAAAAALTAPMYAPAVVGAVLAGVVTLFVGVWVSTVGRGRRGIGFINLCFSFLALVVAVAQGGDFDPD